MRHCSLLVFALLASVVITTACGSGPMGGSSIARADFAASPSTIQAGQKATLAWHVKSGSDPVIDNGIGSVGSFGSADVSPQQTTIYTMTVTSGAGPMTFTAEVKVNGGTNSGGGNNGGGSGGGGSTGGGGSSTAVTGVLTWKRDETRTGTYDSESRLTPATVNTQSFGKKIEYQLDGLILAQPLYVSSLDMGGLGTRNVLIGATEHGTVFALDADGVIKTPLWKRSFLTAGATPMPDNYGGRSTFDGEVGVTGTPTIDPATGYMYFVSTQLNSAGKAEQWLHEVDIRNGNDVLAVPVQATKVIASVPGDGLANVNGTITFDPSIQNQRPGLLLLNGVLYIAWGSFSDRGEYHGWVMAYDAQSLNQIAVWNSATKYEAKDIGGDHGGGASFWAGGAGIAADSDGAVYVVAGDGTFDADRGGPDYGDSVIKLKLVNNQFQVMDWFAPANQDCLNAADLEIGSGGVAILPQEVGGGRSLIAVPSKEGRMYILDRNMLGHYAQGDTQIPQSFMVGGQQCVLGQTDGTAANSTTWQRMYATPAYWNGNLYVGTSNGPIKHYKIANGSVNATPASISAISCGNRSCNTIVTANGATGGILWAYEKSSNGVAILHAFDANNISNELWNSNMNASRDAMTTGIGFATPIDADGRIVTAYGHNLVVYGLLK